jgi:fibronectin-binding autotransporter adhesin
MKRAKTRLLAGCAAILALTAGSAAAQAVNPGTIIQVGAPYNLYAEIFNASATITTPAVQGNVNNIPLYEIGVNNPAATVTVTGPASGVSANEVFFGSGTIINTANVNTGDATHYYSVELLPPQYLVGLPTWVSSIPNALTFVNKANLGDGLLSFGSSVINSGVIDPVRDQAIAETGQSPAVFVDGPGSASFTNLNTGVLNGGIDFNATSGALINQGQINGDAVFVSASNTLTNSGTITGNVLAYGQLGMFGTGTMSATNQASGVITGDVSLQAANNTLTNQGVIAGSVALYGTGDQVTNAGAIGGALTFYGPNGVLTLEQGSVIAGPVSLPGGGATTLNLAYAGSAASPDAVDVSALPIFQTVNQLSGATLVSGDLTTGTLNIEGGQFIGASGYVIAAPTINVAQGAIFGTSGTVIGNINVAGGLQPGTMTVVGNIALAPTSNTIFLLTPAASPQLLVSGMVNVSSGAQLTFSGAAPAPGEQIVLIDAKGGLTAAFTVSDQLSSGAGFLTQNANEVLLTGLFEPPSGLGGQATSTVNYLNGLLTAGTASPALRNLLPELVNGDGSNNERLLNQLTPEPYATALQIGVEDGLDLSRAIRQGLGSAPQDAGPYGFAQVVGDWRDLRGDNGASPATIDSGGLFGGLGWGGHRVSAALVLGELSSREDISGLGAHTNSQDFLAGGVVRIASGPASASLTAAYDQGFADTYRSTVGGEAHGTFDLDTVIVDGAARYALGLGRGWTATPEVGLTYLRVDRGAASEAGAGPLSLNVAAANGDASFVDASVSLSHAASGPAGLQPWISLGLRTRLGGFIDPLATAAFVDEPGSFAAFGADRASTVALLGAGLSLRLSKSARLTAAYQNELADGGGANSVSLGVAWSF